MALPASVSALGKYIGIRATDATGNVGPLVTLNVAQALTAADQRAQEFKNAAGPGAATEGSSPFAGQVIAGECPTTTGFRSVSARARGHGLSIGFVPRTTNPVRVDVFESSVGRRVIGDRLVARFSGRRTGVAWNGRPRRGRRLSDGVFYVRLSVKGVSGKTDTRRITLVRSHGSFRGTPPHYERINCGIFESLKLKRPVFGGTTHRSVGIAYRVAETAQVSIEVRRGKTVVRRYARVIRAPGRTFRLTLSPNGLRPGEYTFRITGRTLTGSATQNLSSRLL
jgi:hypothetical protein